MGNPGKPAHDPMMRNRLKQNNFQRKFSPSIAGAPPGFGDLGRASLGKSLAKNQEKCPNDLTVTIIQPRFWCLTNHANDATRSTEQMSCDEHARFIFPSSIKAKPLRSGDAKLWACCHRSPGCRRDLVSGLSLDISFPATTRREIYESSIPVGAGTEKGEGQCVAGMKQ